MRFGWKRAHGVTCRGATCTLVNKSLHGNGVYTLV
jgi:hypothetical protein